MARSSTRLLPVYLQESSSPRNHVLTPQFFIPQPAVRGKDLRITVREPLADCRSHSIAPTIQNIPDLLHQLLVYETLPEVPPEKTPHPLFRFDPCGHLQRRQRARRTGRLSGFGLLGSLWDDVVVAVNASQVSMLAPRVGRLRQVAISSLGYGPHSLRHCHCHKKAKPTRKLTRLVCDCLSQIAAALQTSPFRSSVLVEVLVSREQRDLQHSRLPHSRLHRQGFGGSR
eukprot:scaffold48_cov311-Pinguiococcus_pyrenoidosus.AAC.173